MLPEVVNFLAGILEDIDSYLRFSGFTGIPFHFWWERDITYGLLYIVQPFRQAPKTKKDT